MKAEKTILKRLNPFNYLIRFIDYDLVQHRLNKLKIENCYKEVSCDKTVKFHEQASVFNIQSDKTKIRIASSTHIRGELLLFAHGGEIQIGEFCYIGEGTRIWSAESIIIGNRVLISHGVNIHDNDSHPTDAGERHIQYKKIIDGGHPKSDINIDAKPVIIEDDVWIGFNAAILKGVKIGKGAIIGACSVVTKDVEPNSVVIGNPAILIKKNK